MLNKKLSLYFISTILFISFLLCIVSFFLSNKFTFAKEKCNIENFSKFGQSKLPTSTLKIKNKIITVEIAKTDQQQTFGLSNRPNISENEGMLFIYKKPGRPVFWMLDMKFPLDFIWIYKGKIVQINQNVPFPKSKKDPPQIIIPSSDIDKVLEVKGGFINKFNISKGDRVIFK